MRPAARPPARLFARREKGRGDRIADTITVQLQMVHVLVQAIGQNLRKLFIVEFCQQGAGSLFGDVVVRVRRRTRKLVQRMVDPDQAIAHRTRKLAIEHKKRGELIWND